MPALIYTRDIYKAGARWHWGRSSYILWRGKNFCPNFPKLSQNDCVQLLPTNFLTQWSFWPFIVWPPKRRLHMLFCKRDPFLKPKTLGAFSTRIFRNFAQIFVKSKLSEVRLHPGTPAFYTTVWGRSSLDFGASNV